MRPVVKKLMMDSMGLRSLTQVPGLELWLSTKDPADIIAGTGAGARGWADKSTHSTANCFVSDGAASNTATTDSKTLTGTLVFTADLALNDYTPSADHTLFSKLAANDGIELLVLTTGVVRFRIGDGASVTNVDSTASIATADLGRCTLIATWTDGVGAGFTINGAALGTAVAAVKTLTNAAATATIGTAFAGRLYRLQISAVYDFKPSAAARGATTVADGISGTWTINASGSTGSRISGSRDAWQGTAASQPTNLPWSGTNYGWLPGVNNNWFETATPTATDDLDVSCRCMLTADGAYRTLVGVWGSVGNYSWLLAKNNSNQIYANISVNGTVVRTITATGITAYLGVLTYYRMTRVKATGITTIYASLDGVAWSTIVAFGPFEAGDALFASTAKFIIGGDSDNGAPFFGALYYANKRAGILGAITTVFNPSEATDGAASWTSSTGEVWTVATSGGLPATIVGRPGLLTDGVNDYMKTPPFRLVQPTTVILVGSGVSWTSGDYLFDGNTSNSGALIQTTTTPQVNINAGSSVAANTDFALGATKILFIEFNGAASTIQVGNLAITTGDAGAGNMGGVTIASSGTAGSYGKEILNEFVVLSRIMSSAEKARVRNFEARRWALSV